VANPFEGIINAVKDAFNFGKSDAIVSEGQNLQNAYEDSNLKTAADMSGLSDAIDVIQWGTCELDKVGGSGAIAGSNDMSVVRSEGATSSAFILFGMVSAGAGDEIVRGGSRLARSEFKFLNREAAIIKYDNVLPKGGNIHDTIIPKLDRYGNVYGFNIHGTVTPPKKGIQAYSRNELTKDAQYFIDEIK